jgi:hypothetical protein
MKKIISAIIIITVGLVTLAGYFYRDALSPLLSLFTDWAILLVGVAGILGVGYLLRMHIVRIIKRQKGTFYSVVLIIVFLLTIVSGILFSPQSEYFKDLILNVQVPVEASLLGVVAITLLYTSVRVIRVQGWTPMSVGFISSALVMLILNLGLLRIESNSIVGRIVGFIQRLPVVGARGLLMGMALGGLIVGLRVLLSLDQPLGED